MSGPVAPQRRPVRLLLLLFGVVAPLAELASIIGVGQWLGVGRTLLLLLAGVVAGTLVISAQGRKAVSRAREDLARAQARVAGAVAPEPSATRPGRGRGWLLVAGVLLAAPGFVSDAVALALLLSPVRTMASAALGGLGIRWVRSVEDRFVAPGSRLRGDVVPGDVVPGDVVSGDVADRDASARRRQTPGVIEGRIVEE